MNCPVCDLTLCMGCAMTTGEIKKINISSGEDAFIDDIAFRQEIEYKRSIGYESRDYTSYIFRKT